MQRIVTFVITLSFLVLLNSCDTLHSKPKHRKVREEPISHLHVEKSEFIFAHAPFAVCHASSIAQVTNGDILVVYFAGSKEGAEDTAIWGSRYHEGIWESPKMIVSCATDPCWNPVLFQNPGSELLLFYKIGKSPRSWKGMILRSSDDGLSWSMPEGLPHGVLGPTKNKPLLLSNGTLICGSSVETLFTWSCVMDITKDGGKTWQKSEQILFPRVRKGIIQPTLYLDSRNNVCMLARSRKIGSICYAKAHDEGFTWSRVQKTFLPNPNSGIDAVKLRDGRLLLVYNPIKKGRNVLAVALSQDDGQTWEHGLTLEKHASGEYSYPAVIQTQDGKIHITYSYHKNAIKHVVLTQ